ncbi:MAG TPA: hypothetical protein VF549_02565 [Solirubrobacteraceae bacterium]|jgi:hypothetical protein
MPRQLLTIELDGLTAGDYLAYVRDPEPRALGFGLRSVTVRAEPLGDTVEAILDWEDTIPAPCAAAEAAGLPRIAETTHLTSTEIHDMPKSSQPARRHSPAPAKPGRLSALTERVAQRLALQARPASFQPAVLRWA